MVGEGGPEGDTAPHNYRGLIFGQNYLIVSLLITQISDLKIFGFFSHKLAQIGINWL